MYIWRKGSALRGFFKQRHEVVGGVHAHEIWEDLEGITGVYMIKLHAGWKGTVKGHGKKRRHPPSQSLDETSEN